MCAIRSPRIDITSFATLCSVFSSLALSGADWPPFSASLTSESAAHPPQFAAMSVFLYSVILAALCICIVVRRFSGMCAVSPAQIIAIIFLVFLILYHAQAVGTIIVSVISMVFLLIIATVGLVAVIKKSRTLCLYVRHLAVRNFLAPANIRPLSSP